MAICVTLSWSQTVTEHETKQREEKSSGFPNANQRNHFFLAAIFGKHAKLMCGRIAVSTFPGGRPQREPVDVYFGPRGAAF